MYKFAGVLLLMCHEAVNFCLTVLTPTNLCSTRWSLVPTAGSGSLASRIWSSSCKPTIVDCAVLGLQYLRFLRDVEPIRNDFVASRRLTKHVFQAHLSSSGCSVLIWGLSSMVPFVLIFSVCLCAMISSFSVYARLERHHDWWFLERPRVGWVVSLLKLHHRKASSNPWTHCWLLCAISSWQCVMLVVIAAVESLNASNNVAFQL